MLDRDLFSDPQWEDLIRGYLIGRNNWKDLPSWMPEERRAESVNEKVYVAARAIARENHLLKNFETYDLQAFQERFLELAPQALVEKVRRSLPEMLLGATAPAPEKLSKAVWDRKVQEWVNASPTPEEKKGREEAVRRVRIAVSYPDDEKLSLDSLYLTEAPDFLLQDCSHITHLSLADNQFSSLPDRFLQFCPELLNLNLKKNRFSTLSSTLVSFCPKLVALTANENGLMLLPEAFFENIPELYWLGLTNNRLSSLPNSLGSCLKLFFLFIEHNPKLQQLPESIKNVPRLTSFNITGTAITEEYRNQLQADMLKIQNDKRLQKLQFKLEQWLRDGGKMAALQESLTPFSKEFQNLLSESLPRGILSHFSEEFQLLLFRWFTYLEQTEDFKENQAALSVIVSDILLFAVNNEEFLKVFIEKVTLSMGDSYKPFQVLNEFYLSYKLEEAKRSFSSEPTRLHDVYKKAAKTIALRNAISKQMAHYPGTHTPDFQLSQFLVYYECAFKIELDLLTAFSYDINEESALVDTYHAKFFRIDKEMLRKEVETSYPEVMTTLLAQMK